MEELQLLLPRKKMKDTVHGLLSVSKTSKMFQKTSKLSREVSTTTKARAKSVLLVVDIWKRLQIWNKTYWQQVQNSSRNRVICFSVVSKIKFNLVLTSLKNLTETSKITWSNDWNTAIRMRHTMTWISWMIWMFVETLRKNTSDYAV